MVTMLTLLLLAFYFTSPAVAQDACNDYLTLMEKIQKYRAELKGVDAELRETRFRRSAAHDVAKNARKAWEEKLHAESLEGARLLERCSALRPVQSKTEEALLRWYQLGKLYSDGEDCPNALTYLKQCRNHSKFRVATIEDVTLEKPVRALVAYCEGVGRDPGGGLRARYSGKAAYLLRNSLQWIIDERPYSSVELEALGMRTFTGDEINEAIETFRRLSPTKTILAHPPFVLVAGPVDYRGELDEVSLKRVYDKIVEPSARRLRDVYFDKRDPQYLIPMYLVGGHLHSDQALEGFNKYCEKVHFRSCGLRVAYYSPYDNSLMVWLATGGGTLNHELVHALMDADFPLAPGWLAEGIASLNEELGQAWRPLDNYRLFYAQAALERFGRLIPLKELFTMSQRGMNSGPFVALHSAMARYFALHLYEHGVLSQVYREIREAREKSASNQVAVVEKHLQRRIDDIQVAWENWVKGRREPDKWRGLKYDIRKEVAELEQVSWAVPR